MKWIYYYKKKRRSSYGLVWASKEGHINVVKWMVERKIHSDVGNYDAVYEAASSGHLDILKTFHRNNYPFDVALMDAATTNGHLDILKWLYDELFQENTTNI